MPTQSEVDAVRGEMDDIMANPSLAADVVNHFMGWSTYQKDVPEDAVKTTVGAVKCVTSKSDRTLTVAFVAPRTS